MQDADHALQPSLTQAEVRANGTGRLSLAYDWGRLAIWTYGELSDGKRLEERRIRYRLLKYNGDPMSCLICAGVAERIQCHDPWEERDCPACGRYRVSDALVLMMMEQGQIFDVSKTRTWLASKRKEVAIPSIQFHEALLVP